MSSSDYNVDQFVTGKLLVHHALYLIDRGARAVQQAHGLTVDGKAGPQTRAAIDGALNGALDSMLPSGKGMFVRALYQAGSASQMVARMIEYKFDYAIVQRIWQYSDPEKPSTLYNANKLASYAKALKDAGKKVWLWGYPVPGKHEEFVSELVGWAKDVGATGVIADPEKPYLSKSEDASILIDELMAAASEHGLGVGVTSYGAPWNFESFPFSVFTKAHFGMPQIYDMFNNQGPEYPSNSVNAWKAAGFTKIVPAGPAFKKTPEQLETLLSGTPVDDGSICFWDWFNCSSNNLWSTLGEYKLGE